MKHKIITLFELNNKYKTLEHSENVARVNIELAEKFNLDKAKCETAAYCHDISGVINPQNMLAYAESHDMYIDTAEEKYPFLLHQRLSAVIAETIFDITDEEILSPIRHHTTLKANPTEYEMALFVADKLAWDQDGTPPFYDEVNNALEISLYHASYAYIKYVTDNNMILYPHTWFTEAKEWLITKIC